MHEPVGHQVALLHVRAVTYRALVRTDLVGRCTLVGGVSIRPILQWPGSNEYRVLAFRDVLGLLIELACWNKRYGNRGQSTFVQRVVLSLVIVAGRCRMA